MSDSDLLPFGRHYDKVRRLLADVYHVPIVGVSDEDMRQVEDDLRRHGMALIQISDLIK